MTPAPNSTRSTQDGNDLQGNRATRSNAQKILPILGAFLLLLLILLALLIFFSEPIVRNLVESKGSNALGRELRIEGDLDINWHLRHTHINAKKIHLANAEGYEEPHMVAIEELDFSLQPLELLRGKLALGVITIKQPAIILEQKSADDNNWTFSSGADDETVDNSDRRAFPVIERLQITDGKIVFRDAVRKLNLELTLDSVSGTDDVDSSESIQHEFTLTGKGDLQNRPFTLEASAGSLEILRDPAADFPLHIKLTMDKTHVELNGVFNDPVKLSGMDASLVIAGDNLADLFYITAIPLPPTPSYRLEGQLTKNGAVWAYNNFKGEVGGSDLSGNLSYDLSGERGFLKADLLSNVLDSADLGGFIGLPISENDQEKNSGNSESEPKKQNDQPAANGKENAATKKDAEVAEADANARIIPDVPLNVERLRATDLDITLNAKSIKAPNLPFNGMEVRFDLRDGQLKLDPLKIVLADGTVDGSIAIDARTDIPPMNIHLNVHKLSLGRFFDNTQFAETTSGFFGGKIELAGTGASLADVLSTSNGDMALIMSGGKISRLLIEAADIDIGEALPLFLGKDKATKIRCAVADFDVRDGVLNSQTFVLDTNDSVLVGEANINLKEENINARLDAKPKDNSLLAARIPITLSGKLNSPRIGLDAERTGARSAAAIALGTLLSPFAALLAFVDRGDGEDVDCNELINSAQK